MTKFSEWVGKFNMLPDTSVQPFIASMIESELDAAPDAAVLDIGCGKGIGGRRDLQKNIKARCRVYWGVEPDASVQLEPGLFDQVQIATLENAELPKSEFDVAYTVFVMEHVADPKRFLAAACDALKPGGVLLILTPNARGFFGLASRWLRRLHVDEFVLKLIQSQREQRFDHYPVQSLCNTEREFRKAVEGLDFEHVEFAFFQLDGVQAYFPGPLKGLYWLILLKRRILKNPKVLDTMVCRLQRRSQTINP